MLITPFNQPSLADELLTHIQQFDFFQAVRLLENTRLQHRQESVHATGYDYSSQQELIRFQGLASLRFAETTIAKPGDRQSFYIKDQLKVSIAFMGLYGVNGSLPDHYTELLMRRLQIKDSALKDFLDLFNHRLTALFYRSWKKYHFYADYEYQADLTNKKIAFNDSLYAYIGSATPHQHKRLDIDDQTLLYYAGLFSMQTRSAHALEQILGDFFAVPIAVQSFQGSWLKLALNERSRLTYQYHCLGKNILLGEKTWDVQSKFKLCIGPLSYEKFLQFLPGQLAYKKLIQLTQRFCKIGFKFDVQLILQAEQVPICQLKHHPHFALGFNTWLKTKQHAVDVDDAVFATKH